MIVGGFSYVGTLARPAPAVWPPQDTAERQGGHSRASRGESAAEPTYFQSISAISPGSLAGVYQSMKAQQASPGLQAPGIAPAETKAVSAILSGAGIPAAMNAYWEMMGTGSET
jgi:hypothetical protein